MKNYTVISDPGIDDLIALLVLYKLSPKSKNYLVSTFGNVPVKHTFQNAKEFISLIAKDWSLIHGSSIPLNGVIEHPWPYYFHGPDGLWGIHPKLDLSKVQISKESEDVRHIISLGPLTDMYKVLEHNKTKMKKVTIMGGVFKEEGNETPYAETNVAFDPESANLFFSNCQGQDVRVVPLDVTRKVYWEENIVDKIPENTEENRWIKTILKIWYKKYSHEREESFNLHDPLAVYLSFFPEEAVWIEQGIKVIFTSKKRGQTVFNRQNPKCRIAIKLHDANRIKQNIFDIAFKKLLRFQTRAL